MDRDAEIVGRRLLPRRCVRRCQFRTYREVDRAAGAVEGGDVVRNPLEFDVGDRECADIAAGAGICHPRGRRGLALLVDHLRLAVAAERGPVQE